MTLCMINMAASMNESSVKLLHELKTSGTVADQASAGNRHSHHEMKRELWSLTELRLGIQGGLFHYDKGILLTTIRIILDNTMALVLAH